jgi:hypothetical protein
LQVEEAGEVKIPKQPPKPPLEAESPPDW